MERSFFFFRGGDLKDILLVLYLFMYDDVEIRDKINLVLVSFRRSFVFLVFKLLASKSLLLHSAAVVDSSLSTATMRGVSHVSHLSNATSGEKQQRAFNVSRPFSIMFQSRLQQMRIILLLFNPAQKTVLSYFCVVASSLDGM